MMHKVMKQFAAICRELSARGRGVPAALMLALMVPVAGCSSLNGWSWDDLNPWSDDEPAYTRLESDIVAAPQAGQAAPVTVPPAGARYYSGMAPPGYYPPASPYYGGYGGVANMAISPSGCPVPGAWSGYPQPAYPPAYPAQGYSPGSSVPAVPGPSSSRGNLSPATQLSQEIPSEEELARRYQVLNNCIDVGGNSEIGFYCDDYE